MMFFTQPVQPLPHLQPGLGGACCHELGMGLSQRLVPPLTTPAGAQHCLGNCQVRRLQLFSARLIALRCFARGTILKPRPPSLETLGICTGHVFLYLGEAELCHIPEHQRSETPVSARAQQWMQCPLPLAARGRGRLAHHRCPGLVLFLLQARKTIHLKSMSVEPPTVLPSDLRRV